jgi:hypothetical protein
VSDKLTAEAAFKPFPMLNESLFKLDGVKKIATWYIDNSEKAANQIVELQERATGWAKETPFAPFFEARNAIARKLIERSASAARSLWQLTSS